MKKVWLYTRRILTGLLAGIMVFGVISVVRGYVVEATYKESSTQYGKNVTVGEVEYFYREVGEENSSDIVMIHGFLGSSFDFMTIMEELKSDFHVVAVDLIGFGLSEKSPTFNYSKKNQADQMALLIDQLGLTNVTLIAHSMGGEVALHLAADHPDSVSELILIDSAGNDDGENPPGLLPIVNDVLVNNYFLQKLLFSTAYSPSERSGGLVTTKMFDEMYFYNRQIPGTVISKFSADSIIGELRPKLSLINQPIQIIWGSDDGFIPLSKGQELASLLENAELAIIDKAGHLPFDTRFDEVMDIIDSFLAV